MIIFFQIIYYLFQFLVKIDDLLCAFKWKYIKRGPIKGLFLRNSVFYSQPGFCLMPVPVSGS